VGRFTAQERQHGLVAAVHAIEVADGQGAGGCQVGVVEAAENLHPECQEIEKFNGYIVTEPGLQAFAPEQSATHGFVSVVFDC
jgi:hypothetical protein